jgi:endonuclease-8
MPEGDTIHKVAAALRPFLEGKSIRRARIGKGPRVGLGCAGFAERLEGRWVEVVFARGKHLWIRVEGGIALRSHLGLHGSWHRYAPGEPWKKPEWQASLALWTEREVLVCFNAREVECLVTEGLRTAGFSARLGPDLLAPGTDVGSITRRARQLLDPETQLADVLLDQRVAGGIGNVYKSEILFVEGQHPAAALGQVSDGALQRIFGTARDLMDKNLGAGPRVTRFEADGRGILWVYGRSGRPCLLCGAPIRFERLGRGMRSTYWCPKCQPGPGAV